MFEQLRGDEHFFIHLERKTEGLIFKKVYIFYPNKDI